MATLGNTPRPAYVYDTETDTWVPVGVGAHTHAYIPNTLVDAKGDLITATANDVPAILSKGADGTVLVSDSTTQTGLAWQPYGAIQVAGKNKIINGDFSINQRNATTTTSAFAFLADRWKTVSFSGSGTWSISTINYGSFAGQISNKAMRITSSSSSNDHGLQQSIEDVTTLAGQTVTVSFWIRSSGSTFGLDFIELLQYFGSGGSTNVYSYGGQNTSFGSSWTKVSANISVPSVAGKTIGSGNYLNIRIDPTATIPNGEWIEITHIQLEAGPIATPFTTHTGSIQGELAACQRYYYRYSATATNQYFGSAYARSATNAFAIIKHPVTMRTSPSMSSASGASYFNFQIGTGDFTVTSLDGSYYPTTETTLVRMTSSGMTAGQAGMALFQNASAYIELSAEL